MKGSVIVTVIVIIWAHQEAEKFKDELERLGREKAADDLRL